MKRALTASPIHKAAGFTLIELIVAVSIIAILTGGGLAVFTGFRSTRIAQGDANIVTDTLSEAKRLAVAGEKPIECAAVTLTGYQITFNVASVELVAICAGGTPPTKTRNLTTGTIVSPPSPIVFKVLSGGTVDQTVEVCAEGHLFRITVTSAGSVSEPVDIDGGC